MGESFLGLPNRFKIVDNLLESTYNPNHALSAYQGYRLGTDYLNRSGGEEFAMTGPLITTDMYPTATSSSDIGTSNLKYQNVYASYFRGNADTSTKFDTVKTIEIKGSVTGSVTTDFDGNVTIDTSTNHNHDSLYLKLTGGTLTGALYSRSIVPTSDVTYSLGTSSKRYLGIFTKDLTATNISGSLKGNASSATKLATSRNITVSLTPSTVKTSNYGVASFDGSSNITITVQAPYLPVNGGTLYGNLAVSSGNITPYTNKYQNIGDSDHKWNYIYGSQIYGDSFYGNLYGNVFGGASFASKLSTARNIKVVLNNATDTASNYGVASFDGSSNTTIAVWAPYLPINGGSIGGNILPTTNDVYYLGSNTHKFKGVYATNLYGNADTSTKLATARTLTIGKTGKVFDGSSNVSWSLAEIGAADASVGTTILGRSYSGVYIVGTKTGYLESSISIPPGVWIIEAHLHHCCGGFRIGVVVEDIYTGGRIAEMRTINPGECKHNYWSTYKDTAVYVNNSNNTVQACLFIDTVNIGAAYEGYVYEGDWRPMFMLKAVKLK